MKNKNKTKKVKENNSVVVETVEFKAKEKKKQLWLSSQHYKSTSLTKTLMLIEKKT